MKGNNCKQDHCQGFREAGFDFNARNKDLISHNLTGKQIISWSGSFTGGDFRTLIQIWPLTLIAYYSTQAFPIRTVRNIICLWVFAEKITSLLYKSAIVNLDER